MGVLAHRNDHSAVKFIRLSARMGVRKISLYSALMKQHESGFTLIEMMVTVAIAAILASLAVPSFRTMLVKRSTQSAADTLVSDMRYARAQALQRSTRVVMCSLAANSTSACSGDTPSWVNGWLIFVDKNSDDVVNGSDEILRVQQPMANIASIQSAPVNSDHPQFRFEANGWTKSSSQTFIITPTGSVPAGSTQLVCISNQGRPSVRPQGSTACN
jgi:type IV fimbrial biogenesis protein FimT